MGMWAFVMTVNGKAMKGSNTSNDCALDLISDVLCFTPFYFICIGSYTCCV